MATPSRNPGLGNLARLPLELRFLIYEIAISSTLYKIPWEVGNHNHPNAPRAVRGGNHHSNFAVFSHNKPHSMLLETSSEIGKEVLALFSTLKKKPLDPSLQIKISKHGVFTNCMPQFFLRAFIGTFSPYFQQIDIYVEEEEPAQRCKHDYKSTFASWSPNPDIGIAMAYCNVITSALLRNARAGRLLPTQIEMYLPSWVTYSSDGPKVLPTLKKAESCLSFFSGTLRDAAMFETQLKAYDVIEWTVRYIDEGSLSTTRRAKRRGKLSLRSIRDGLRPRPFSSGYSWYTWPR